MRPTFKIMSLLSFIFTSFLVYAYDIEVDGIYYNIYANNKTAVVVSGDSIYKGDINIPETIAFRNNKLSVVGIEEAFEDCSLLQSIILPNSLTSIGNNAFSGCSALTSIILPNKIASIGQNAFRDCSALKTVGMPDSLKSIGADAFNGCLSLHSIDLPQSMTVIGSNAFANCTALFSIEIPDGISEIEEGTFLNCVSLEKIILSHNIVDIHDKAFYNCSLLDEIEFPYNLQRIGKESFYKCSKIKEIVIPDCVNSIGENAFYKCNNISLFSLGSGINEITGSSLWGCTEMETLEMRESRRSLNLGGYEDRWPNYIRYSALPCDFENLKVKKLIINRPIRYLSYFRNDDSVDGKSYKFPFDDNPFIEVIFLSEKFSFNTEDYSGGWGLLYYKLKGEISFSNLLNLKQLEINHINCSEILPEYFVGCNNIAEITIKSIESIGQDAYKNYTKLHQINLENVEKISSNAFMGCSSLTHIILPSTIKSLSSSLSTCPLETIILEGENPPSADEFEHDTYLNCELIVPCGFKEIYLETSPWCNFWSINEKDEVKPEKIILSNDFLTLHIGESFQIIGTVFPQEADTSILWTSSDSSVATVSNEGIVTGISIGESTITAKCGEIYASCKVSVLGDNGVDNIFADHDTQVSVYSTEGILLKKNCSYDEIMEIMPKGIYIIVYRDCTTEKVVIRQ